MFSDPAYEAPLFRWPYELGHERCEFFLAVYSSVFVADGIMAISDFVFGRLLRGQWHLHLMEDNVWNTCAYIRPSKAPGVHLFSCILSISTSFIIIFWSGCGGKHCHVENVKRSARNTVTQRQAARACRRVHILDSHRRHIGGHCGPANGRVPFLPRTGSDDRQRGSMTSPASHASKPRSLSSNLTAPLNSALFFETYVSVASEGVRLIRDDSARMSCTLKSYFPRSDNNIGEDGRSTIPSRGCPKEAETPASCVCGWAEVVAAAGVRWKLRACRTLLWRVFLSYMTVLSHWSCQARLQTCSERTYVEANVLRICVRRVRR